MKTEPAPQQDNFQSLYRSAFKEFGARALWSMRPVDDPTPADALAIAQALRTHGGMDRAASGRKDREAMPCRSLSYSPMCSAL